MRCAQARETMQARLDGTLSPGTAEEMEAHLAGCAACRAEAADLRAIDAELAAEETVDPPEGMAAAIARRAAARARVRRQVLIPGWLEGLTLAGAGVTAGVIAVGLRLLQTQEVASLATPTSVAMVVGVAATGMAAFGALYYRG